MKTLRQEAQELIIETDRKARVNAIYNRLTKIELLNKDLVKAEADIKRIEEGGDLFSKDEDILTRA